MDDAELELLQVVSRSVRIDLCSRFWSSSGASLHCPSQYMANLSGGSSIEAMYTSLYRRLRRNG